MSDAATPRAPLALAPATRAELRAALPFAGRFVTAMFDLSLRIRRNLGARTALAVVTFALALVSRWATHDMLPPGFPFLTFFPAVVVSAFFGGAYAGALCGVLGGLAAWYWFIPPVGAFPVDHASVVAMAFYTLIVVVDVALFHMLLRSVDRLLEQKREMADLIDRQTTLFSELQHRVANNLAFVSALFGLQKRKLSDNPAAVAAFDDARARLDTMGRVHRRLYNPANAQLPLASLFKDLASDLVQSSVTRDIRIRVDVPPIALPVETVMTLSLVVMEVVTNALKHAFASRESGEIAISLHRLDARRCRLIVRDDGGGFVDDAAAGDGKGLGMRILRSFAASLNGELSFHSDGGAVTQLDFDAPDEGAPA
ncbi:MAG: DUF4118 domain-containing protein [Methylobacteriaceae bacterium]|nr:DUF4118 domain-containing protein [Methylobacteriaceae bacterium]